MNAIVSGRHSRYQGLAGERYHPPVGFAPIRHLNCLLDCGNLRALDPADEKMTAVNSYHETIELVVSDPDYLTH
jgi:hypothetical protein